jgi:porphobilinogen deaminase
MTVVDFPADRAKDLVHPDGVEPGRARPAVRELYARPPLVVRDLTAPLLVHRDEQRTGVLPGLTAPATTYATRLSTPAGAPSPSFPMAPVPYGESRSSPIIFRTCKQFPSAAMPIPASPSSTRGEVDAVLLAVSGLRRIDQAERITEILPVEVMCPAIGAGVLGLQCRQDDTGTIEAVSRLGDTDTWREITAERTLLHVLQGHCNSPIAGYAHAEPDGRLTLHGEVFSLDGKTVLDAHESASAGDNPAILGTSVALTLLRQGARAVIDGIPH